MSCVPRVHYEENKYGNQMVGCMIFTFVPFLSKGSGFGSPLFCCHGGKKGKRKKLIPAGFEPAPPKRPGP